ncbi:2Fe-2S iron-sulfur cluster-binding protein [Streptomyces wuyuanensis]|uniref:2Fe-2S iron-sulfur cluster-binding protein n=1 Tax=Streptomyces wuyuanensis TaxID=1196353 RepID=UPI00381285A3
MSSEENESRDTAPHGGGWQPIPQGGEYDAEATAFVRLPPEDMLDAPLAAPGHGYVPPQIPPVNPDDPSGPAGAGGWTAPQRTSDADRPHHWAAPGAQQSQNPYEPYAGHQAYAGHEPYAGPGPQGGQGPRDGHEPHDAYGPQGAQGAPQDPRAEGEPHAGHEARPDRGPQGGDPRTGHGAEDPRGPQGGHDPHTTGQWTFQEADEPPSGPAEEPATGDLTGQWTIPVAQGDIPEESGEFTTSALASQWGGRTPPATLPGGAPAPWATIPDGGTPAEGTPVGGTPASGTPVAGAGYPATLPGGAPAPWATEGYPAHDEQAGSTTEPHADGPSGEPHGPRDDEAHPEAAGDAPDAAPAPERSAEAPQDGLRADSETGPAGDSGDPGAAGAGTARQDPAGTPDTEAAAGPDASAAEEALVDAPAAASDEHPHTSFVLRVNGADRPVTDAWIGESLLYVLRERLGLAGAKDGCSQGECGACNVKVDGRLVASCLVPAATAAGSEVRTVEGLAADGEPSDVQRALAVCGAVQCGFCIPGMAMTVHDLLEGNHAPTELETRQALSGNLCRCSGYRGVLDAVREVVAGREASAAAAAEANDEAREGTQDGARIPHQAPPGAGSVQPHPHDGGMV